jgi:hypothetical protein
LIISGCTATRHRLEPYQSDVVQAQQLELHANEVCRQRRGAADLPPHRLTTDGCFVWPDSTWATCCIEHDIAYWCGGNIEERRRTDAACGGRIEPRNAWRED